ncbi:ACT domain-containing protein [Candidatus Bathyarchaeota archaeon]|nr:MAG: ACT domain-containing protein [Candidatus Bathyarchaeota archaeon]
MAESSISKIVQYLIDNDPSIQDALARGYGNYSAIARLLKPIVEEIYGRKIGIAGLITAVKRARVAYTPKMEYQKIVAESKISLRTDVAKISVEKTRRSLEKARLISADFPEAFFQLLEGASTLTLIIDEGIFDEVRSVFREEEILGEKRNLAALIVQSPREIVDTPGCIAAFYNPISRAHINIEETASCFTETVIVLKMEDAAKAFSILTELISRMRRDLKGRR